jgi:hypothetical protein
VGTYALRVAGARTTAYCGHTEAVVFHAVDLAIETAEICEHKRGRRRISRHVKYPEPWGRGRAARLTRTAPHMGLHLTASSVRCAPASGSSSGPTFGTMLLDAFTEKR